MTDVLQLIDELARAEALLRRRRFLSPCAAGAQLRVRIDGLVQTFWPNPRGYEGWGLFQPIDAKRAQLVRRPDAMLVERYLMHLPLVRLHVVRPAKGKAWWAMPAHRESFRRRVGDRQGPLVVHLTKGVAAFETIRARFDGATFWFEAIDLGADPMLPEHLACALRLRKDVDELSGITPELVDAFVWARLWQSEANRQTLGATLAHALKIAGGTLETFREQEGGVTVQWRDRRGHRHSSYLRKGHERALEVRSAGAVCLQGLDADFDLESLVGVMSDAPDYFY